MYLDNGLREHNLLQAIARVNRPYDETKDFGLIVDYCGITKELQKALAIFEEEDIKGALEPAEKELEELRLRHLDVMSFFKDLDRDDDDAIIEKFEPVNIRDEFEYAFKMFSKSLEAILPQKEADPYIDDYKYAGKKRFLIRNNYGGVGQSLREYGKKVQQLIDDHIRSLNISPLLPQRNITYENFLAYVNTKFKSDRARTALIKNKARQIIREFAPNNPAYYEKLKERLEKIIEEEEERRKGEADYFNNYKEIYEEALSEDRKRKDLGFSTKFEFAVYSEIKSIVNNDKESKNTTKSIFEKIKRETEIVGWKTKTSSKKNMTNIIYDILTENKFPDDKVDEITSKIIELAERNL